MTVHCSRITCLLSSSDLIILINFLLWRDLQQND